MSLSILEIKAIPDYKLLSSNVDEAKQSVSSTFSDLLSYFSSVVLPKQVVIELIFQKSTNAQPKVFITLRSDENATTVSLEKIIKTLVSYLSKSHFSVEEVSGENFARVVNELRNHLHGRIVALTKSEKIIASNISYSGYYYYTDILDSLDNRHNDINNYNSLINQLMSCESAMVSFQLIPTQLSQEEFYALSNLSAELTSTTQGVFIDRQMVRENLAEVAKKTYSYYSERVSQPFFIGNIVIASQTDDLNGLVSALKTGLQFSNIEPIDITCIEVEKSCSLSYDFYHFPWNLHNQLLFNYRNQNIWNGTVFQPTNLFRLPFLFTTNEASSFFKLPVDDGKIQGFKSNKVANDNETLSNEIFAETNIKLGKLVNTDNQVIGTDMADFTRHTLIVGAPGSGKTTFALNLLLQFHEKGIPFLAIEPTKTEYRALIDKIPNLQVFTPGNSSVVPFIINPFIPPKGIRLEQYIPSLMSAFRAAFSMESPLDVIFLNAIRQCYAQYGWKNSSTCDDKDVQPFGLFEFVLVFKKIVSSSSYKPDTKANIETGGTFRLLNLIDQNKYIYDTINTIPIDLLLKKSTVIELNAIADDEQKALVMALLLVSICLYTKNQGSSSGKLNNVFMIDEAHVLLDAPVKAVNEQNKAQGATVKSLQKMIAEIRSFGTGIIIADQLPSKVTNDIVANTDLKVAFRLVEKNERDIIANSTNMTEQQSQHLARLKKGEALTYYSSLESPKMIVTPDIRTEKNIRHSVLDNEVSEKSEFWEFRQELLMPYFECSVCPQCLSSGKCNFETREKADYYASHIIATLGANIKDEETFTKYMYRLHELVIKYEAKSNEKNSLKRLCNCTKIHFMRNVLLESNFPLSRNTIVNLLNRTLIKEVKHNVRF